MKDCFNKVFCGSGGQMETTLEDLRKACKCSSSGMPKCTQYMIGEQDQVAMF